MGWRGKIKNGISKIYDANGNLFMEKKVGVRFIELKDLI